MIIKWQDNTMNPAKWHDFNPDDINHLPVAHAVALFSNDNIPVVIKEGEQYIVNTPELFNSYRKKGSKVMMIDQVNPDRFNQRLSIAGFVGN